MAAIALGEARRGDTFRRTFTLSNSNPDGDPWIGTMFDEVRFTIRTKMPITSETDDDSAISQVAKTGGGVFFTSSTDGVVRVEASETTNWEPGTYYWDIQGTVSGSPVQVYTLAYGTVSVISDVTRTP